MRQNWRQDSTLENDMWYGGRILGGRIMKRMMSWTPTPSHLMKQMPRKRGPRHKGLESTKWNDEISYLGSEKLMSFWAIFLVLHFASLICGNPWFGCYKGGNIRIYIVLYIVCMLDFGCSLSIAKHARCRALGSCSPPRSFLQRLCQWPGHFATRRQ